MKGFVEPIVLNGVYAGSYPPPRNSCKKGLVKRLAIGRVRKSNEDYCNEPASQQYFQNIAM